jgi:hypothetical protein
MVVAPAAKQLRPAACLLSLARRGVTSLFPVQVVCRFKTSPQGLVAQLSLSFSIMAILAVMAILAICYPSALPR